MIGYFLASVALLINTKKMDNHVYQKLKWKRLHQ